MTNDELKEMLNSVVDQDLMTVDEVMGVNHKPHPYMIGAKHIEHSDMYLDIERAERAGVTCAQIRCYLKYHEHTFDLVAFLAFKRNLTNEEAHEQLLTMKNAVEEAKTRLDGFAFVDKGFRVLD